MRLVFAAALATVVFAAHAEELGEVDTVFKFFGPDHKIIIEAFDDPKVNGITCYLWRAKTGGMKGAVGWPRIWRRHRSRAGRSARSSS